MTKRYLALTVAAVAIFLNLVIPACGSKTNNSLSNPNGAYSCQYGQQCVGGMGGTPMFPTAVYTSLDSAGSAAQIQIYAVGPQSVNVQAQVYLAPGNLMGCPPGNVYVQGQGNWQPNYGGTLGYIQANLTSGNFQVQMSGEIFGGQDPYESFQTQFYFMGSFYNSCDPGAKGL